MNVEALVHRGSVAPKEKYTTKYMTDFQKYFVIDF
jgi:hypothetical protein